jgi:hypothetical protein
MDPSFPLVLIEKCKKVIEKNNKLAKILKKFEKHIIINTDNFNISEVMIKNLH